MCRGRVLLIVHISHFIVSFLFYCFLIMVFHLFCIPLDFSGYSFTSKFLFSLSSPLYFSFALVSISTAMICLNSLYIGTLFFFFFKGDMWCKVEIIAWCPVKKNHLLIFCFPKYHSISQTAVRSVTLMWFQVCLAVLSIDMTACSKWVICTVVLSAVASLVLLARNVFVLVSLW